MMISTIVDARVVTDKAFVRETKDSKVTKIRVADNASRKNDRNPARFVNVEAWGGLGEQLAKLSKGDVLSVSGELKVEQYEDKQGQTRRDDLLTATHFRVQKSESFFGAKPDEDEAAPFAGVDFKKRTRKASPAPIDDELPASDDDIPF